MSEQFNFDLQLFAGSMFDGDFKSMVESINSGIEDVDDAADTDVLENDSEDSEVDEEEEEDSSTEDEEEEEEEEEEEDAETDEREDATKNKGKKEAVTSAIQDLPLYEISKEEVPQYSLEQVQDAWYNDTMKKGVEQILGSDLSEYKTIDEIAQAVGVAKWNRLDRQAQEVGKQKAQEYQEKIIQPYQFKALNNQIAQEVNTLKKLPAMKELPKYLPRMAQIAKEMAKDFPTLDADPVRAIPLYFMMAREEELSGAVKKIAKDKQKNVPKLDKGGVDRNVTTKKKRDSRDQFIDKMNRNKKEKDPLGGIFELPKGRMILSR